MYYPKDNKKGIKFDGDRELEDLKEFIAQKSVSYKAKFVSKTQEVVQEEL